MKSSPLAFLRRSAPSQLTQADVAARLKKLGFGRTQAWVSAFEKGFYRETPGEVIAGYARVIGLPVLAVRRALAKTLRARK